ncbi:MAG: translation initiation factor IF-2 [Candidatus Berkelbacteria bacterium]
MIEIKKKPISIPAVITVKAFAEKANLPVGVVISELMKNGILASINETIDFETASIIGEYLNYEVSLEEEVKKTNSAVRVVSAPKDLVERPPVVTIMGHVDHGKTTLLDSIRKEHVALGESGGITQHISAYQVTLTNAKNKDVKGKTITFIDTPGHAAFSAMREHGALITDIVVLIVAANDGVMPQTREIIENAISTSVPLIVAINKVDLPDADIMKVKQQLSDAGLLPEEWGGKTVMVEVSAKTGLGIDALLEMILLQAEMMELKANPAEVAVGVVIESHMQKGAGAMATVLIENGTIRRGQPIAIGSSYGKVRILEDFASRTIESAGPSTPVRIAGLKSMPNFGDRLLAFTDEKEARENAIKAEQFKPTIRIATARKISHEDGEEATEMHELKLIIKCDVVGSLEAVKSSLANIYGEDYQIKIIADGVGTISESDITLARATGAQVLGFRVAMFGAAKRIADKEQVKFKLFPIIYEMIDYIKEEIVAILPPIVIEDEVGNGKVLGIFRDDKKGYVAGGMVESGHLAVGDEIKIFQGKNEKYRAKILSLRREKSDVKEVQSGSECGFGLPIGANVAVGDTFVAFKTSYKKRVID